MAPLYGGQEASEDVYLSGWMITTESHSSAMFNSTCSLSKGSALTDSLLLGGVLGEGSSPGFEMDLYVHPLGGEHPRLTKTTHRHKQSHMHGHALKQRQRARSTHGGFHGQEDKRQNI